MKTNKSSLILSLLALLVGQAHAANLGTGYKNAKCGMSKSEVKKQMKGAFDKKVQTAGGGYGEADLEYIWGSKQLSFYFFRDKLQEIIFHPFSASTKADRVEANTANDIHAVLQSLTDKYGPGTPIKGEFDPFNGIPLQKLTWEDETLRIIFQVDAAEKYYERFFEFPNAAIEVHYVCRLIAREQAAADAEKKNWDIEKRKRAVEDDL